MKKNTIFFWVPKTGGTSIFNVLKRYGCRKLKKPGLFNKFNNTGMVTFGHVDIQSLLKKNIISAEFFKKSFKFGFVRNPWDRLVSLYFYLKYNRLMSFEVFCNRIYKAMRLRDTWYGGVIDIFYRVPGIRLIMARNLEWGPVIFPLPKIGPFNVLCRTSQLNPQAEWLADETGKIVVDFVGRFENFNGDLKKVFSILRIKDKVGYDNKSKHRYYKKYYNRKTIKLVAEIYRKDIELFGYQF